MALSDYPFREYEEVLVGMYLSCSTARFGVSSAWLHVNEVDERLLVKSFSEPLLSHS